MPRPAKTYEQLLANREYRRRERIKNGTAVNHYVTKSGPRSKDIEARLAEIPLDTRDLTARLFGDPLPERSALKSRQREDASELAHKLIGLKNYCPA